MGGKLWISKLLEEEEINIMKLKLMDNLFYFVIFISITNNYVNCELNFNTALRNWMGVSGGSAANGPSESGVGGSTTQRRENRRK